MKDGRMKHVQEEEINSRSGGKAAGTEHGQDTSEHAVRPFVVETYSCEETMELAARMAQSVTAGTIICLDGDLGAGKTAWAKGFAKGLGITEPVVSPTFTIMHIYTSGRLPLYHYDVYRIEEPEEMNEIGYEEYFFGDGVCLIEWASQIEELIPDSALHVTIRKDPEKGDDYREITCR